MAADAPVCAQLPQARLYSIFPCGGKAGTTVELSLTGSADLDGIVQDGAERLLFDHPGITAVPMTQKLGGRTKAVPNVFKCTIRPEVPSGIYEVYAGGRFGLSNPRLFFVGSADESRESEPNDDPEKPNELLPGRIINGVVGRATDVDFFRFQGKRGERIVCTCRAADLDSRLSAVIEVSCADGRRLGYAREELRHDPVVDVVLPDDGSYLIKVHDFLFRGGPEYVYRLLAGVLPYIDYVMPSTGVAGTTGQFTLFGRNLPGGRPAGVSVAGRPLEKLEVAIPLPRVVPIAPAHTTLRPVSAGIKMISWTLNSPAGESNPVLIELTSAASVMEKEPNDTPALAQPVPAPGEIAGRFQSPGDTDYFTFHADAGQVFYIDVFAERIGSLADPYLILEQVGHDARGAETTTRIASMDDDNTNIAPAVFDTRTDDPTYRFQAQESATYRILLRDRSFESRGDPRLVYHLSIRPEKPDFELVALPQYPKQGTVKEVSTWALGLRKGDSRDVQLLVLRRDGFREPIEVWAEDLPAGVSCRGAAIPSNAKTAELIFTAAANAPAGSGLIRVFGKARLGRRQGNSTPGGAEVVRQAIPATIVWSAEPNVPAVSRIGQSLALSVMNESAPFQLSTDIVRVEVNQGRQVLLPLNLARRNGFDGDVAMNLVGATPASLELTLKSFPRGRSAELVRFFVPRFERPGTVMLYWKLQAQVAYRRNQQAAAAPQNLIDFPDSTPILLTVKPAPIELRAVVPNGGSLKKGGRTSVKVDVKRRKGFNGYVTLGVPLPPGVKGIDAKPIIVPPDKNGAEVAITADAAATPGLLSNMVVRAQMDYQGKAQVDAPITLRIMP